MLKMIKEVSGASAMVVITDLKRPETCQLPVLFKHMYYSFHRTAQNGFKENIGEEWESEVYSWAMFEKQMPHWSLTGRLWDDY